MEGWSPSRSVTDPASGWLEASGKVVEHAAGLRREKVWGITKSRPVTSLHSVQALERSHSSIRLEICGLYTLSLMP